MKATDSAPSSLRRNSYNERPHSPVPRRMAAPLIDSKGLQDAFAVQREPEDAKLTGTTRSLGRRLLALNLGGSIGRHTPLPN